MLEQKQEVTRVVSLVKDYKIASELFSFHSEKGSTLKRKNLGANSFFLK